MTSAVISCRAFSAVATLCGWSLLAFTLAACPATATETPRAREEALPAPTLEVAALGIGHEAEVATYDVSVAGDSRPLEAVSILSAPPAEVGGQPALRWQFYSEAFESPNKAYHVRLITFFDLDPRDLTPVRVTRSFLTWEGGGCCFPAERKDEGMLVPAPVALPPLAVGPGKVLPSQVPLLVRALELPSSGSVSLEVLRRDGETVPAQVELVGREPWRRKDSDALIEAEKIVVRYESLDPLVTLDALMLATGAEVETYWREAGGHRQLLAMESGLYGVPMRMRLREESRMAIAPPAGSGRQEAPRPQAETTDRAPAVEPPEPLRLDRGFLALPVWDDGQAELAFYDLDGVGPEGEGRLALSILVKHRFDPTQGLKVGADDPGGVDTFLSLFLYSLDDPGSPVPRRRFFSVQARRDDLAPFDASVVEVTGRDQCGSSSDLAPGSPEEDHLSCHVRDAPASAAGARPSGAFPSQEMPLVLRALDLGPEPKAFVQKLPVRLPDGRLVTATVRHAGRETVTTPAGTRECDRFEVSYSPPSPTPGGDALPASLLGPLPETETYWRATGGTRQIVRLEAGGRTLELIEEIRARHWAEDFYPRLERVTGRP